MAYLYPLLPIMAGLVMLGVLLRHRQFSAFLAARGVRAEGEIVGYSETNTSARMIVRFETEDGRVVEAKQNSTGWTASRHGDVVTVDYDPDNPENIRIVAANWLSPWVSNMFTALGLVLIAIGCLLAYLAWW
ncbi:DUF3592 domain-containing protein [Nocardiopsis gilva YIM 90087]|uniref:DUF3592 domain-containing protein n=1 Tax=Nocardiopsis gilva YIM 90087 TaxID=1235441 RepID=A0A223SBE9_9ACTN|nr:DUF3592 domain-containing protein [Nocardiopsis gilva]ASU85383.1 DUF3592 domain-containing protein [Nocardiopsis gilva YIM 90087]